MNKKYFYLSISLVILFLVFFFAEDKVENQTEVSFWKESWKTIRFQPPKDSWCGTSEPPFIKTEIQMESFDRGWKKAPIFSVSQIDPDTSQIVTYEGNYNVKNSFSDLSVLKTKFIDTPKEDSYSGYCLLDSAPSLTLSTEKMDLIKPPSGKGLFFGKKVESDSSRILARVGDRVISPYAYLLEKFRGSLVSLRERQFVTFNGGYVSAIEFSGQGLKIKVENSAKKNQYDSYVNHWSRTTGERIVLPPDIGNDFENQVKSLRADLYPDDENGPGFPFLQDIKKGSPEVTLLVSHSDDYKWKFTIFPKVEWKEQSYRPVIREIAPYIVEEMSFMKEEAFQNLLRSALNVKNASRFERPNQKIQ
jgi:hypothetical protein